MFDTYRWLSAFLLVVFCAWGGACDSDSEAASPSQSNSESNSETKDSKRASGKQETFTSDRAPYRLELPEGWTSTSPEEVNAHADLAATRDDEFFLIVIPQELPTVSGVDPPDVDSLKSASLERMTDNVDDFSVEREGPVELDGTPAVSVFAEGMVEDEPVQYVTIYATRDGWGYQIVAWGPRAAESKLVEAADAVAEGWQFAENSVDSPGPDARPAADRDVKSEDSEGDSD